MIKIKVATTWIDPVTDYEYRIEGFVYPESKTPHSGFDRFAEPDSPEEVEITEISLDGRVIPQSEFSPSEIKAIEQELYENAENEIDYADY